MPEKLYKLNARIMSGNTKVIYPVLEDLLDGKGSVRNAEDEKGGFIVEANMKGTSAKDLNRYFLSSLRKVEKKTTLRAAWIIDNTVERYFDYVLKKKEKL